MNVLQPDCSYHSASVSGQPCSNGCNGQDDSLYSGRLDSQQRTVRTQSLNEAYLSSLPETYDHSGKVSRESLEQERINQKYNILMQLEEQLSGRIDQVPVAVPMDWENVELVLDQVMETLSDVQDSLAGVYPHSRDRARCLSNFLQGWQNRFAIRLQSSGLPEADQQAIKNHLSMNLSVLLGSMDVRSVVSVSDKGFGDLPHLPSINPANVEAPGARPIPPFYMQRQEGAQCGRHAANMFFGFDLLASEPGFENIRNDLLFNRMKEADPCAGSRAPLVMLDSSLFGYDVDFTSGCSEKYVRKPVPDSLDDLPGDFVLVAGGHYVCFRKDDNGQWYLLDSVASQPRAMKPSVYLGQIFNNLRVNGRTYPESIAGKISVICRDPGQQVEGFWLEQ